MNESIKSIIEVIYSFSAIKGDISSTDNLLSIGIDSLRKVELIVALEDKFNIQFDDSELDPSHINTVDDVIYLVAKHTV